MKTSRPTTTLKQKKVLKLLGENGGNLRKAIKEAGYSQKYADNPQRLTTTQTWQEITDETFPDALLALVHRKLLENEYTALKALDLAYKLKGRYKEAEKPVLENKQIIVEIMHYGDRNKEKKIIEEEVAHALKSDD
ncbi:MAG: hypothetical protein V4504_01080 [Patescibacteria group bacterium]